VQDQEIQMILDVTQQIDIIHDYRPRLIIFAFMKNMIYDLYRYVQVIYFSTNMNHE
jgi:hypothetical protein